MSREKTEVMSGGREGRWAVCSTHGTDTVPTARAPAKAETGPISFFCKPPEMELLVLKTS